MISGHYIQNYYVEKPKKLQTLSFNTWYGENNYNTQFSPHERTVLKCRTINFFLYNAKFFIGGKGSNWGSLSTNSRLRALDGLYDYVIKDNSSTNIIQYTTTPFARRMRLFL